MAFSDIVAAMEVPGGATERYRQYEGLERQLNGTLYKDLQFSFEQEKRPDGTHVSIRERRPSVIYQLPHLIVSQTQGELFGDEQFPYVKMKVGRGADKAVDEAVAELLLDIDLPQAVFDAYHDGSVGAVAVVIRSGDGKRPFYEIVPAKFAEPVYMSQTSKTLASLMVTYPISPEEAKEYLGEVDDLARNYWYRYIIGPDEVVDYAPLPDHEFAKLGQERSDGSIVEFKERKRANHGFQGRVPAVYTRNMRVWSASVDGPATWWPIVDMCVEMDYVLSQAGRGLRYSADPMLFVKRGDLMSTVMPMGYEKPAGGMATTVGSDGSMVKGVTQTLVGGPDSDAKILEINAAGIKEEREFFRELREGALEVLGGMKAKAKEEYGAMSGKALQQLRKPLRMLIRRQRRPWGDGCLLSLLDLTLHGLRVGALACDTDISAIPVNAKASLEWPSDDTPVGEDLLYTVQAYQLAMGRPLTAPGTLMASEDAQKRFAGDIGLHDPMPVDSVEPFDPVDVAVKTSQAKSQDREGSKD